jgi:nitroimidazol reductase NimA-like FMN-containing flavoprotein (pyridoxamine 5'-phosphate oxidase superfamily)
MPFSLSEIEDFLNAVRIPVRLACKTETGWPMIVSLWFLHQDGQLYCATQKTAKVILYLTHDPRCAFEVSEDRPPYCGVRGQAMATIDDSQGQMVLERLLYRYLGGLENDLARKLLSKSEKEVAIVLEPRSVYTWDFSRRMKDVVPPPDQSFEKICP